MKRTREDYKGKLQTAKTIVIQEVFNGCNQMGARKKKTGKDAR